MPSKILRVGISRTLFTLLYFSKLDVFKKTKTTSCYGFGLALV